MFAWLKSSGNGWVATILAAVVLTAGLAVAGVVVWNNYVKDLIVPKRLVEVAPGLFRSGQISERLVRDVLESNRIGVVIDLTAPDMRDPNQRAERDAIEELGILPVRLPLNGSGDGDIRYYAEALWWLAAAEKQGTPALVHCAAGSRRSAGVVASYQVLVQGVPPAEAYEELDRYGSRPVADSPLLPYLNENMATLAHMLVERGVIPEIPEPLPLFPDDG